MAASDHCLAVFLIIALSLSSIHPSQAARRILQTSSPSAPSLPTISPLPKTALPPLPAIPVVLPKATLAPLPTLFKTPHDELTKEIHELKDVVNTLQQKLDMAAAPPSTYHSHLDPGYLRLRLTSRSSYGRKYQSTADPTYNHKDKSGDHVTRSGSCYRRDSSVEDSTNSSPAQAAEAETLQRSIHRKRKPEFRT
ncbi:hypothetical protein RJ639_004058 [Escallonia herrerae]|uniref:Uncharacterized protein n=1 Tax=Escallonia herrerae TaxID=1293975 RepID=A0AA88VY70_9ASTE|nr:hypothetical protein RJ639_004058 [Escallonia herrerae]